MKFKAEVEKRLSELEKKIQYLTDIQVGNKSKMYEDVSKEDEDETLAGEIVEIGEEE